MFPAISSNPVLSDAVHAPSVTGCVVMLHFNVLFVSVGVLRLEILIEVMSNAIKFVSIK